MTFAPQNSGRIGRSSYWTMFVVNVIGVIALVAGSIAAFVSNEFLVGILLILAIIPVGIYFRVVMMRRCRDIGWPAALPWIFFGAGMLASLTSWGGILGSPASAQMPSLGLSTLVSLADLVFMIVIGCIRGGSAHDADYDAVFGSDEFDTRVAIAARATRPAYRDEGDEHGDGRDARWDAAIQNALSARAGGGGGAPRVAPPPRPAGFGRKPVC